MKRLQVIDIMSQATNLEDWNKRSEAIFRDHNGNRPDYWYQAIIVSGLFERKRNEWEQDEKETNEEVEIVHINSIKEFVDELKTTIDKIYSDELNPIRQKEAIENGTKIHEEFEKRLANGETLDELAEMQITDFTKEENTNIQFLKQDKVTKIQLVTLPIQHIE